MPLSMHAASVPVFVRMLDNMLAWLDKAEAHAKARGFDPNAYLAFRLAPDMIPLSGQVQIASDTVKGCVARLAAVEPPKWADDEKTLDELRARIRKTIEYAQSVPAAKMEGSETREISVPTRGEPLRFPGEAFLKHFAAAELLLPLRDDLRPAASGRRRAREDGLPRRALRRTRARCRRSIRGSATQSSGTSAWRPRRSICQRSVLRGRPRRRAARETLPPVSRSTRAMRSIAAGSSGPGPAGAASGQDPTAAPATGTGARPRRRRPAKGGRFRERPARAGRRARAPRRGAARARARCRAPARSRATSCSASAARKSGRTAGRQRAGAGARPPASSAATSAGRSSRRARSGGSAISNTREAEVEVLAEAPGAHGRARGRGSSRRRRGRRGRACARRRRARSGGPGARAGASPGAGARARRSRRGRACRRGRARGARCAGRGRR